MFADDFVGVSDSEQNLQKLIDVVYIVHREKFRSNAQIAIVFARRNRPRINRSEIACIYLRLRAFAFACVCVRCTYMRIYVRDVNSI